MSANPFRASAEGSPFGRRHQLGRFLWSIGWWVLFRFSPRPCHTWRAWVLGFFGASLGKHCHIYPRARIWAPWNLICHDHACIADDAIVYNQAPIQLGSYAVVSQGTHLCTGTHNYRSSRFELIAKPITIEDQAWLGAECFVLPGVTIGAGAVIGARAVVTKDMPRWTVCAGHPCAPIKPRLALEGEEAA